MVPGAARRSLQVFGGQGTRRPGRASTLDGGFRRGQDPPAGIPVARGRPARRRSARQWSTPTWWALITFLAHGGCPQGVPLVCMDEFELDDPGHRADVRLMRGFATPGSSSRPRPTRFRARCRAASRRRTSSVIQALSPASSRWRASTARTTATAGCPIGTVPAGRLRRPRRRRGAALRGSAGRRGRL
ncbi:hypothetical protein QJS66_04680 [Kocuria rhizophila]|nr:hypothetical protein QJS66_04680 [Kocuria rhizophila]